MERTACEAAAALIRERASAILPRVVADSAAGDASERDTLDLQRRLTTFLERRIPPWVEALEADHSQRPDAIGRLLQTDAAAAEHIPPVVLLGTVASAIASSRPRYARRRTHPDIRQMSSGPRWTFYGGPSPI